MLPELKKDTIKVCPQCKATFACNPPDCWCSNLTEVLPMLENGDCYCPDCHKEIADEKAGTLI